MCLITPLGKISISIDGKEIDYTFKKINPDRLCNDVDGRYSIIVPFTPNGKNHQISCTINNYLPSSLDEIESGERLALKSFYTINTKLSIGAIGEALDTYNIITIGYDYENDYLSNGVSYELLELTKTNQFVYAICWINDYTDENELQTWFGADPTTFTLETVYGDYDRDPRTRVSSTAYLSLVNEQDITVRAGDDAADAAWCSLCLKEMEVLTGEVSRKVWQLHVSNEEKGLDTRAEVEETCREGLIRERKFQVLTGGEIAVAHAAIIVQAMCILADRLLEKRLKDKKVLVSAV